MTTLRVVVADDHPLMLTGITVRLSVEADIEVVATATNCAELVAAATANLPDVVVADVSMPDGSVLDFLAAIREAAPHTRILLLSATDDPAAVSTALQLGAAGFLSKETDSDTIATHVRDIAAGHTVLDARSAAAIAAQLRQPEHDALSARELEVLRLVAEGLSNPEIGKRLFIAPSTIKTHLERAYGKLGVNDRAAAVARAKDRKLL
ncbi:MAG: response regulator transcription factor [Acidimicrobiales bacterium]|nr:response regulator transcription factor [Acidimicrobiales bacterium]